MLFFVQTEKIKTLEESKNYNLARPRQKNVALIETVPSGQMLLNLLLLKKSYGSVFTLFA